MSTQTSYCWDDEERKEAIITRARRSTDGSWDVTGDDGWSFGIAAEYRATVKEGDRIVTWGGIGFPIRGMAVNGTLLYYRTPAEQDVENKKQTEAWRTEKIAKYESHRADYDARVAALPVPLRERIEGFRAFGGDQWRWEYEPYELASCEEAARMVQHFKDADEIRFFGKLDYEQQQTAYPQSSKDRSGNTWGMSLVLAALMYDSPESVPKYHAAICALVGCKDAGCWAARSGAAPQGETE